MDMKANGEFMHNRPILGSKSPKRLLIIEDDDLMRVFYRSLFNRMKERFTATLESQGEGALRRLQTRQFDAAVLDWDLPGLSGLDIIKDLRSHSGTRNLPVIMISGRSNTADQVDALENGADDFISKPFPVEVLMARLTALLRRADR
jgi:two-component system phosphate regulon response regulator PhoB